MTIPLTVQGTTYNYPTSSDQSWGDQATNWASAVTNALGPGSNGSFLTIHVSTTSALDGTITLGDDLVFSGIGPRITGDLTSIPVANRVLFQTSTVNANSAIGVIPNGTGQGSNYTAFNSSDPDNSGFFAAQALSTDIRITAGKLGTGTYLPLTFYTSNSERMQLPAAGGLLVGTTAAGGITGLGVNGFSTFAGNSTNFTLGLAYSEARRVANSTFFIGASNAVAPDLVFSNSGGTERVRISNSGTVAVTTNINGGVSVTDGTTTGVMFASGAATNSLVIGTTSAHPLVLFSNNVERARFTSSGSFGVGNTSPTLQLEVGQGASGATVARINGAASGVASGSALYMSSIGVNSFCIGNASAILGGAFDATSYFYSPASSVAFGVGGVERLRIDSSTGTSSFFGNIISTRSVPGASHDVQISNSSSTAGSACNLTLSQGAVSGTIQAYDNSEWTLGTYSAHPMIFKTSGASRLTIGTTGIFSFNTSSASSFYNFNGSASFGSGNNVLGIGLGYNETLRAAGQMYYIGASNSATPTMYFSNQGGSATLSLTSAGTLTCVGDIVAFGTP